jgi:hypothetical protein
MNEIRRKSGCECLAVETDPDSQTKEIGNSIKSTIIFGHYFSLQATGSNKAWVPARSDNMTEIDHEEDEERTQILVRYSHKGFQHATEGGDCKPRDRNLS